MPSVTALPIGQSNGDVVTEFVDSVGTTSTTWTYPKEQNKLRVKNNGKSNLTLTVGTYSNQTITPGDVWENEVDFTTITIQSASGVQQITVRSTENALQLAATVKGEVGKNLKVVACVLRNTGAGFGTIVDSSHDKCNVSSVTNDNTTITVNFDFTAKKVISFVACPDETYALNGYNFGASVGPSSAIITAVRMPRTIGGYVHYDGATWQVLSGSGNLAVVSFTAGVLTLSHDDMGDLYLASADRRDVLDTRLGSNSATQTQVKFYDSSNVLQTTPSTDMKVFVTRSSSLGRVENPNNIAISNSNIWCYGIFEV